MDSKELFCLHDVQMSLNEGGNIADGDTMGLLYDEIISILRSLPCLQDSVIYWLVSV